MLIRSISLTGLEELNMSPVVLPLAIINYRQGLPYIHQAAPLTQLFYGFSLALASARILLAKVSSWAE